MATVILTIHLILALALIGIVLVQRSEGGGLGIGGGGGGAMSGRAQASAMSKVTWVLAGAFICTSIALTVIASRDNQGTSVLDRVEAPVEGDAPALPNLLGDDLLPPSSDDAPAAPPPTE